MASSGGDTCIAGSSTRKSSCSSSSFSSNEDDSDTNVYPVSGSEDGSDDAEFGSSSGDYENISEANIASAHQWVQLDVDNTGAKPPWFPFLAVLGKAFNLTSPDDRLEYIEQFLDDELITLVVNETNCNVAEKLKCSCPSEHSHLKKWVPVTKEEMWVFLALLLMQDIVHKPWQQWYWSKNKLLFTPIFGEVIPCNRFLLIM
ncbi:hypothetical protein HPB49_006402 [Dermacentor silvarum]|uniref:Uncharacterized protein n=1 Tax=Dermacentor silvarum TaxID=543639 RepID=A0ACB8DW26_DERSI|nr:hypothetical protein HPB49_006402 [Dermacentor silvarum]